MQSSHNSVDYTTAPRFAIPTKIASSTLWKVTSERTRTIHSPLPSSSQCRGKITWWRKTNEDKSSPLIVTLEARLYRGALKANTTVSITSCKHCAWLKALPIQGRNKNASV